MQITNNASVSLPLAVWLLQDDYDYIDKENYISATSLMKPIRQIVIPPRLTNKIPLDLTDLIPSALGKTIHGSIEQAWKDPKNLKSALSKLGYPESVFRRIRVNPDPGTLKDGEIPIYIEQRSFRQLGKWEIGGKFDLVTEGIVQDVKSTSAYTWLYGGKDDDYILQGSIYRWLNQDKITEDFIRINFVFTDWQKASAKINPNYPQYRVAHKDYKLLSLEETEAWILNKLKLIEQYMNSPESQIPECTDAELWRSDPKYKFYSNPEKMVKATKNFDSMQEARAYQVEKGGIGKIVTVPGEAKRCDYCSAFDGCTQKDRLGKNGG